MHFSAQEKKRERVRERVRKSEKEREGGRGFLFFPFNQILNPDFV